MKRLFVFLACLISLAIFSCSDSKDDNGDDPNGGNSSNVTLELSTTDIVFEAGGGEKEFYITCNGDWTIANASQWCKTDITSGNGNATISVTVNPSELYDDQNTNITVKAGTNTKILTVTQKKKDALLLTKDKYDLPTTGGDITVEVKSNITYTTTIPQEFNWIKQVNSKSRALETKNLNFKIEANSNTDKREGFIIFKDNASELADTVHVYQAQKDELILTQDTYNVPAKGETINVELKTNVDYEVIIPEDAKEWVEQLVSRASRVDKLSFTILESTIYDERQAEIIIKDKNSDLADTLHVIQKQVDAIILRQNRYEISSAGETISVEILHNIQYEIIIPDTVSSWIKLIHSRAIQASKLNLNVLENKNHENRTAQIIFKKKDGNISDTLYILQQQRKKIILSQKTLNLPAKYSLNKVEINGNDYRYYDVIIPQDAQNWIKYNGYTSNASNLWLNFVVEANSMNESRKSIVVIKEKSTSLTDTLIINQDAMPEVYIGDLILKEVKDLKNFKYKKIIGNLTIDATTSIEELGNTLEIIDGNLTISNYSLSSFKGLSNLIQITGDFKLEAIAHSGGGMNELQSFEGLENLELIGGDFEIYSSAAGDKFNSANSLNKLESFKGLGKLKTIKGNFKITSIEHGTYSHAMVALKSFEGLENLETIGKDLEIISCNKTETGKSLKNLSSFKGLDKLQQIGGNLRLLSNLPEKGKGYYAALHAFTSFEGLGNLKSIGGSLEIGINRSTRLANLSSFTGMEKLEYIGNNFIVQGELPNFTSFSGLTNLNMVMGDFVMQFEASKTDVSLQGLNNLQSIGGNLTLSIVLLKNLSGLNNLNNIGKDFTVDHIASFEGLGNISTIKGNLSIGYNTFTSFKGLENLTLIEGNMLMYEGGDQLLSFEGLNNLKIIQGDLELNSGENGNTFNKIISFEGLNNLQAIEGCFKLTSISSSTIHNATSFNALESFEGLNNLERVGGDFILSSTARASASISSSFQKLKDFSGLSKLKSIGGKFTLLSNAKEVNSNAGMSQSFTNLVSFEGLEHLENIKGDFSLISSTNYVEGSFKMLNSFAGLNALVNIEGSLHLKGAHFDNLSSFSGLNNLRTISGNLYLGEGEFNKIESFDGLNNLEYINGDLQLENAAFENFKSFQGLNKLTSIKGGLILRHDGLSSNHTFFNKLSSFAGLNNLETIGGDFLLQGSYVGNSGFNSYVFNSLESFEGLNNLKRINGNFQIYVSAYYGSKVFNSLISFKGLENLANVGGKFQIYTTNSIHKEYTTSSFSSLKSLEGLSNLTSIDGDLLICGSNNEKYSFLKINTLTGLDKLSMVGGNIKIESCFTLENISSLSSLKTIRGNEFTIHNCRVLNNFTSLLEVLQNYGGIFTTSANAYNPTMEQILNGQGKPQE